MNGGIDPDPCRKCWSCGKLTFVSESAAMGAPWLKDGFCSECRATGLGEVTRTLLIKLEAKDRIIDGLNEQINDLEEKIDDLDYWD